MGIASEGSTVICKMPKLFDELAEGMKIEVFAAQYVGGQMTEVLTATATLTGGDVLRFPFSNVQNAAYRVFILGGKEHVPLTKARDV